MVSVGTTKIYQNKQTIIPSKVRKELEINENTIIDWSINPDKTVTLTFKNKKATIGDLAGLGRSKEKTNAVDLKRSLYK